MKEFIFHVKKVSLWFGHLPILNPVLVPHVGYFNGGTYWKFSCYWLKYVLEFSGPKKDKTVYKKVTFQELNKILKDLK